MTLSTTRLELAAPLITLLTLIAPAPVTPFKVKVLPFSSIPPVNVKPPVPAEVIVLSLASVTKPLKLAAAELPLDNAPPPNSTPVPLSVTASAPTVWPFKSKAASIKTVVPASVVPSPLALPSITFPSVMVVKPV